MMLKARLFSLALFALPLSAVATDEREVIVLSVEERTLLLAEMRTMLSSVQGVVAALADEDNVALVEAARASGRRLAAGVPASAAAKLPQGFKELGGPTHMGFDTLAMAAEQGETSDMLLMRLGDVLGNCVSCHARYRFEAAPSR